MSSRAVDGAAPTPVDYDPFAGPALARIVLTTEPQREVWLADRLGREASLAFNESVSLRITGNLNVEALRGALQDLVQRHESLRSTISANGEELCIGAETKLTVPFTDCSTREGAEPTAAASARQRAVETPFDLEHGPLFRAEILKIGSNDHLLIITAHHIVCDGWSFGVLVRNLASLYARRTGSPAQELAPPVSFADYASAQTALSGSSGSAADEAYWLSRFAGSVPTLDLPTDRSRSAWRTFTSRREDYVLDAALVSEVRKVGARNGASLFATLLGGFVVLLQRIAGSNDIAVGVPAAGQAVGGLDNLVGHCVNLLPLRVDVNPTTPMKAIVAATQTAVLDAYEHQGYTFGTLLKKLAIERDPSRLPLVSVMFNLDQALDANAAGFPGVQVEFASNPRSYENFELFVNAVQVNGDLHLECQYNADLFDGATIRRWLACYETLLRAACVSLDVPTGKLALVSAEDRRLLASWNETSRPFSRTTLVHEMVEAQASRVPERTAVSWQGVSISYGALNAQANRIAHCLRAHGVRRGALVGLHVERGPEMIAAALAVLKAGAAYVPLDPSYPCDRLTFMAEDAGLSVLVTESTHASPLAWPRERALFIDTDNAQIAAQPDAGFPREGGSTEPEDPAYVIYTSGSTGKPKGVRVPHRAVVNFLESMAHEPGLSDSDRLIAVTTLSFDIAVNELFLPLCVGAEIILASHGDALDGAALSRLIEDSRATTMQATPATWRLLLEADWRGNRQFKAMCGGEVLSADLARRLLEQTGSLWNMYGPTETTVWSTCHHITGIESDISIGRPIANTTVWILDEQQQLCPIGVPGEIWIGGDGVTLGYLNRPALTAERFIADPFAGTPGARLYRTGDRGRWRADGLLEHLGRLDSQVKVRGYRIELGEIEVGLASHADVARAVVIDREDRPGDVRLVAYVVARPGAVPEASALKAHLKAALPDYMIPQHFIALPGIPLLPNGKVDRKSLPAPNAPARSALDYVAPRTDMEKVVAAEMEASLGMPGVSIHDDFFALGGHSLLAAQLTSRLNRSFKTNLSIRTLFEAPTVARLAQVIEGDKMSATSKPIAHRADQSHAPMSQMQERMWLLEEMQPGRVVYNTPAAHRLHGRMNEGAFERAFREMVRRQSSLRTSFERDGAGVVQRIHNSVTIPPLFPAEDLSALEPQEREARLRRRVDELCAETFDLSQAPLFRVRVFRLGEEEHVLFFMAHHIVWDGWSFDLFYDEMSALYGAFSEGKANPLPDLAISYGDFAAWHREWLRGSEFERQLVFWRERLARIGKALPLPIDNPRRPGMSGAGGTEVLRVGRPKVDALHELAKQLGTTVNINMLAAYCVLLYDYSRQANLIIGTPVRGRNTAESEAIIGYFNNLLPLQIEIEPGEKFSDLVNRVRAAMVEIFAHPGVPLEALARELSAAGGIGGSVLYQALFSFQDARQRKRQWGQLRHDRYPVFQRGAAEDLGIWFVETTEGMYGGLTFNSDILNRSTAQWLRDRYFAILNAVITAPNTMVVALVGPERKITAQSAHPDAASDVRITDQSGARRPYVAPQNDLEISLTAVWENVLGVDRVGINDNFFDLGGNSLSVIKLSLEIGRAVGIEIGLGEVFRFPTISKLIASWGTDRKKNASVVVPLQSEGDGLPVFCICGINIYRDFARSLGPGQPVFGVFVEEEQALVDQMIKGERPTVSIDRLVDAYDKAIARFRPDGPYRLAGLSFGGILAAELASKMRKRGAAVDVVFLLDAILPEATRINWIKWVTYQVSEVLKGKGRKKLSKLLAKFGIGIAGRQSQPGVPIRANYIDKAFAIGRDRAFDHAAKEWQQRSIFNDFKVILFRASDRSTWGEFREFDDDYGWRRHFGDQLSFIDVIGGHQSIIEPPYVTETGGKAREYLKPIRSFD